MNVYFEISPKVDLMGEHKDHRYFAAYNIRKSAAIMGNYRQVLLCSDRVWVEDEDRIHYLKHRSGVPQDTIVDLKEFFWIKLKSIEL